MAFSYPGPERLREVDLAAAAKHEAAGRIARVRGGSDQRQLQHKAVAPCARHLQHFRSGKLISTLSASCDFTAMINGARMAPHSDDKSEI